VAKLCGGVRMGLLFDGALLAALLSTRRKVKEMEQATRPQREPWQVFEPKEPRDFEVWPPEGCDN
jgi:hypothetical protein